MSIDTCANPACRTKLDVDHITLITTAHVRRFCSVECIEPSRLAHEDELLYAAYAERAERIREALAAELAGRPR